MTSTHCTGLAPGCRSRVRRGSAVTRAWLLVYALALLWPSWQSWLGRTVMQSLGAQHLVEVCTPAGMQWVALNAASGAAPDSASVTSTLLSGAGESEFTSAPANQPFSGKQLMPSCLWSMGHTAHAWGVGTWAGHQVVAGQTVHVQSVHPPRPHGVATHLRVLLMAAMRAPPAVA